MSSKVLKCRRDEGTISCAFMPTSLDSRSHGKLKFKRRSEESSVLSANHPQNSKIKVEGTLLQSKTSKYAIGVYEEGSSKLYLYEASPFSVQAMLDGVVVHASDTGAEPTSSYLEKKKDLINTYAPVKKQRQLRAAVNAVVSDEKIEGYEESREVMKQSIADDTRDEKSTGLIESNTGILGQMRALLPPFDLEATSAGAIFDFSSLFPESLVAAIDPTEADSTCNALFKWINDDFRGPSPEDEWAEMKNLKTIVQLGRLYMASKQEKKKNFAKLVNIVVSMMYLYKLRRRKNWTPSDIYAPLALAERLAELFCPDKQLGDPIDREGTNKLFAHLVVFLLRLTPFWEFDFSDLKTDLNVQSKELVSILSFSCIALKGKSGLVGHLQAPLKVQPVGGYKKQGGPRGKR